MPHKPGHLPPARRIPTTSRGPSTQEDKPKARPADPSTAYEQGTRPGFYPGLFNTAAKRIMADVEGQESGRPPSVTPRSKR